MTGPEDSHSDNIKPLRCPACGTTDVRPSFPKGLLDRMAKCFSYVPYRCRACSYRFYRHLSTLAVPPPPPPQV